MPLIYPSIIYVLFICFPLKVVEEILVGWVMTFYVDISLILVQAETSGCLFPAEQ